MSGDQLQSSRPAGHQRRYCVGAGLYHLCCCKFDRWPPTSPAPSRSDREALGAQRFLLGPPGGSFATSQSRHHCPPLPSPGMGQLGPLMQLVSCLCLWRLVYCSGRGWMSSHLGLRWTSSHPGLRWMSSHPGLRWMSSHPGLRWTFSRPDQRLVGLHPDAFQRLQLPGSQFGSTSVGEVIHMVRPWVLWVPAALGGEGRHGAGLTVPLSNDSSL